MVGKTSSRVERAGGLSEAGAGDPADMARRWGHAGVIRSRGDDGASVDGGDHRWRDAAISSAGRSVSGGGCAGGALARTVEGGRALAGGCRGDDAGGGG